MSLLDIDVLDAGYGDFQALFGIDLHVDEAETVSMIGANGAGKSTLLKAIAGMLEPMAGEIRYAGESLAGHPGQPARRRRHLARPGGASHLPVAQRRGEPAHRWLTSVARVRGRNSAVMEAFPMLANLAQPIGRPLVGW